MKKILNAVTGFIKRKELLFLILYMLLLLFLFLLPLSTSKIKLQNILLIGILGAGLALTFLIAYRFISKKVKGLMTLVWLIWFPFNIILIALSYFYSYESRIVLIFILNSLLVTILASIVYTIITYGKKKVFSLLLIKNTLTALLMVLVLFIASILFLFLSTFVTILVYGASAPII